MNNRYDVVIAGAGPAGGQCARDLVARGYDVVVLETESEDEFPRQSNKSTAGTFPSMMASFGIPDDVVMSEAVGVLRDRDVGRVFVTCVHPLLARNAVTKLRRAGVETIYGTDTIEREVSAVSVAPAIADEL